LLDDSPSEAGSGFLTALSLNLAFNAAILSAFPIGFALSISMVFIFFF